MRFLALLFLCLSGVAATAHAAPPPCNGTTEGTIVYNNDHNMMQFCDGSQWLAMTGGGDTLGALSCANTEIAKWNGTTWACAADATGALADNSVTNAKMADDAIGIAELSATGTASATTYLRGDNTWATISGGLPSLTSANIWVGNGSNAATAVSMSGDATINNAGVLTIGSNAVGSTEITNASIALADLSATGTASATTYLRGDNTWATISGGNDNLGDHIATQVLRSDTNNTDDLGTTAIRWKDGWFAGTVTGGSIVATGSSPALNGVYLPAANTVGISANSIAVAQFNTVASGVNYFAFTPSSGTNPITLAAAGGSTNLDLGLNPKGIGSVIVTSQAATAVPLEVKGAAGQSVNLTDWQNSAGASVANVSATGVFTGLGSGLAALNATNLSTGTVPAARMPALTGDVTMTAGTTATNIASGVVGAIEITDASITGTDIAATTITGANIANTTITVGKLSATGTANNTTFLRGDGQWAAPSGGGGMTQGSFCGLRRLACADPGDAPVYSGENFPCNGVTLIGACTDPGAPGWARYENISNCPSGFTPIRIDYNVVTGYVSLSCIKQ